MSIWHAGCNEPRYLEIPDAAAQMVPVAWLDKCHVIGRSKQRQNHLRLSAGLRDQLDYILGVG